MLEGSKIDSREIGENTHMSIGAQVLIRLERIGAIQNSLPFDQRWWCNRLGLIVRYRSRDNSQSLWVGGRYVWYLNARRHLDGGHWNIIRYKSGKWQKLVAPTLAIAKWVSSHSITKQDIEDFDRAVYSFKRTGTLALP